jgi:TolA-binding protein/HEAT repeat protein
METKVMKIMWTIAALAGSVTLVNAQQSPRAPTTPAPAPAPKGRVRAPEAVRPGGSGQMKQPGIDRLLETPPEMSLFTPGVTALTPMPPMEPLEPFMSLAPLAIELPLSFEFAPFNPRPGQSPLAIDLPSFAPMPSVSPMVPAEPLTPMVAPFAQMAIEPMISLPELAPEPMVFFQGPVIARPSPRPDRELEAELRRLNSEVDRAERERVRALTAQDREASREAEALLRTLQREIEQSQREQANQDRALARELALQDRENQRVAEQAIRQAQMEQRVQTREAEQVIRSAQMDLMHSMNFAHSEARVTAPAPWAHQDVADSAYRVARELFNRGEYGQAVQAFRSLPTRYPNSQYAPEAAYYQAFSLFRIGGTAELREALAALEASKAKYPNARSRSEMTSLATRIRGVLASRGDAQAAAELRATANEQTSTCDREEQAVQAEAMNQLSRMEGGNVNDLITRVLARKDECAIPLRRTAVFLVGNRRDAQAVTILSGVARNDPSEEVQVEAIGVISRLPNEEGVTVLEELTRSDNERIQRAAVRSLVRHPSAKARTSVRTLVEREDVSERVRAEALSAFDSERATADDVAWLRALYAKLTTPSLKARTLSAIVRVGGPEVDQWLVTIARDDNQPSEIRATAMRRIGDTMPIADLARLYDTATQQRFRGEIISVLGKRKEDAATDKLIDIVKNGTDPSLRTAAIRTITNKNDARATQLLLEIINK